MDEGYCFILPLLALDSTRPGVPFSYFQDISGFIWQRLKLILIFAVMIRLGTFIIVRLLCFFVCYLCVPFGVTGFSFLFSLYTLLSRFWWLSGCWKDVAFKSDILFLFGRMGYGYCWARVDRSAIDENAYYKNQIDLGKIWDEIVVFAVDVTLRHCKNMSDYNLMLCINLLSYNIKSGTFK